MTRMSLRARLARPDSEAVLLTEVSPPRGAHLEAVRVDARPLLGVADAIQVTDMPMATFHMAGWAVGRALVEDGFEVVLNATLRDRNTLALQAELLGAAALGIQNVFCLRGDPPALGDHPGAEGVYEIDVLEWIALARQLRDEGRPRSGLPLLDRPDVGIGAAAAPASKDPDGHPARIAAKIQAGADFLITQPNFEPETLRRLAHRLEAELGVEPRFVAGISPVYEPDLAERLGAMPGLTVPEDYVRRLRLAAPAERRRVAWAAALETAVALDRLPSVRGFMLYPSTHSGARLAEDLRRLRQALSAGDPAPTRFTPGRG